MRAMLLHAFGKPMEIAELPAPRPGPAEALIRVGACGLCGTDIKVADGAIDTVVLPLVPGHELAGEVVELGPGVTGLEVGDHVVVHIYITCGRCFYCRNAAENNCEQSVRLGFERPGGFAELVTAPVSNCYRVARTLPFEEACLLSGSIATPFHALRAQSRVRAGETVVIIGAGGLGLHSVQLSRELGGRVIAVDLDDDRLELARSLGAAATINARHEDVAARVRELTAGEGADVVVPVVGGQRTARRHPVRFCVTPPSWPAGAAGVSSWRANQRGLARAGLQRLGDPRLALILQPGLDQCHSSGRGWADQTGGGKDHPARAGPRGAGRAEEHTAGR